MALQWMALDDWKRKIAKGIRPLNVAVRKAVIPDLAVPVDGDSRTVKFVISTGEVDRDKDTVNPKGWDLTNYKANPAVVWAHDYAQLPIGRAITTESDGSRLTAVVEFMPKDLNPMSDTVYRMLKGGWLRATSVGFKPKSFDYNSERKGVDFHAQELLEISVVPIPSNPGALAEAKAAGLDVEPVRLWAVKTLVGLQQKIPADSAERDNDGCSEGNLCPKMKDNLCALAEGCPMGKGGTAHGGMGGVGDPDKAVAGVIDKRGRVLSAKNEAALVAAVESLTTVLNQVRAQPADEDATDKSVDLDAGIIAKRIVERDDQFCVVTEDGSKTLGCHPTRAEALQQLRAVEANKHRAFADVVLPTALIAKWCASCGDHLTAQHITGLKWAALVKEMPPQMQEGLCDMIGRDPDGFRTRCMEHDFKGQVDDVPAFCNWLKTQCTKLATDLVTKHEDTFEFAEAEDAVLDLGDLTPDDIANVVKAATQSVAHAWLRDRALHETGRVD